MKPTAQNMMHVYEIRPRKDKRGFDLLSDALPFGGLWYLKIPDAIEYAEHYSRAHDAVIRVYDAAGNVIETHEHRGEFKEWWRSAILRIVQNRSRCGLARFELCAHLP